MEQPYVLETLGRISQRTGIPHRQLLAIVEAKAIRPALTINGVWHFDNGQIEAIVQAHQLNQQTTNPGAK